MTREIVALTVRLGGMHEVRVLGDACWLTEDEANAEPGPLYWTMRSGEGLADGIEGPDTFREPPICRPILQIRASREWVAQRVLDGLSVRGRLLRVEYVH